MQDTVIGRQFERLEAAARDLDMYGYAVVHGVLNDAECQRIKSLLWDAVESLTSKQATPVDRNNPATHGDAHMPTRMKGIIQEPPILSHCAAAWAARKAAAPYFARLYGTPNISMSFDRINMLPARAQNAAAARQKNWMHSDQTPLLDGLHSIQGFIDLEGTGHLSGGLVVAIKSHRMHHTLLADTWGIDTADNWIKFTDDQRAFIDKNFTVQKVLCTPGSLVLWDSRTFHENTPPKPGGHARAVIYVSAQPNNVLSHDKFVAAKKRRVKAFQERRATTHVALTRFKMFGTKARVYGRKPGAVESADRVYHIDEKALGVPNPAQDLHVASLIGATSHPAVAWGHLDYKALLRERFLSSPIMEQSPSALRIEYVDHKRKRDAAKEEELILFPKEKKQRLEDDVSSDIF